MAASDPSAGFYLGRVSAAQGGSSDLIYDPVDLTTHAVVTGYDRLGQDRPVHRLVGRSCPAGHPGDHDRSQGRSGQPAAALSRRMAPQDFRAWIDPDTARREG